jgi:hypothetical protein
MVDRIFNINYTLSRLKAMLTAYQLKHAVTYDVKIFYPVSKRERNIYFHRCIILKINKVVDIIKCKVHPRKYHEILEVK